MNLTFPIEFPNYKAFAEALGLPVYTSSTDRRRQEQYLSQFYEFTRKAPYAYVVTKQLKPYVPPSRQYNPRKTNMEIAAQLLHAIAEKKAEITTPTRYGVAHEVVLTLADAFELVGMASPSWRQLKHGKTLSNLTTLEQRRAYFTHHDVCFGKWKNTITTLVKSDKIIRTPWFVIVERLDFLDNKPIRQRLAEQDEISDIKGIDANAMFILQKRYPELKLKTHMDIWLKFKEKEYNELRRELIANAQAKQVYNPASPTTWLDTFPVSKFAFTDMMMKKWEPLLKSAEEIIKVKRTLTLKMYDWYRLPENEDKYENVKLCLVTILGDDLLDVQDCGDDDA